MAINIKKTQKTAEEIFSEHLGVEEIKSTEAKGHVSISVGPNKSQVEVKNESEVIHPGVMVPVSQLCKVQVEGGHTINLGNYESARIGVMVSIPCPKDDLESTYEFATNWVSEKLSEALKQIKN